MGITFEQTPEMFGILHIGLLIAIALVSVIFFVSFKKRQEKTLIKLIGIMGIIMAVGEIWKQWFVPRYVYTDGPSTWFFPWQLCSMAMYCSVLLPYLKGKVQNTVLVFLSTYSLLSSFIALLIPADMMRPQIWLFCHGFLYHAIMILECLAAILILRQRSRAPFYPAVILFSVMAVIAEIINVISHHIINDTHVEANMFYITPYYPTTQPVFHQIAVALGILPGIIIYLAAITIGSYLLYRMENKFSGKDN
ncbi:MAG: YwaF family protein [Erysipelotrichaceae bacterium]|nr:YwaF family protein [Erysipelotrichaceae bacterium]